jgi:hypothetical protein
MPPIVNGAEGSRGHNHVRHILDTWQRPGGRLLFSAGNGINGDCPLASLEALHEEASSELEKIGKRQVSFVDCLSFVVMRRKGVETALAFDPDFPEQGFPLC